MANASTHSDGNVKSRNAGPMTIEFIDDAGESSTRVPSSVHAIRVIEKATSKAATFNLSDLTPAVIHQLAAVGAKKAMETLCRNNADEHGTNIIASAQTMFGTLKAGKLYTRGGDGTPKAKADKFDYGFWMDVVNAYTVARTGKKAEKDTLDKFHAALSSVTPTERKELLKRYRENKAFAAAELQIKSARAAAALKEEANNNDDEDIDLF